MKRAGQIIGIVIIVVLAVCLFQRQSQIADLERKFTQLQTELNRDRCEKLPVQQTCDVSAEAELKALRKEHAELLRLRGEVTRLRQSSIPSNASPVQTDVVSNPEPLTTNDFHFFTTNLTAQLGSDEAFVTGGWELTPGKQTFMILTPDFSDGNSVTLAVRLAEIQSEFLNSELADALRSGNLTKADSAALIAQVEKLNGVDLLTTPMVSTANGRQAQIAIQDQISVGGQPLYAGPAFDFIPTISPDGSSLSLNVQAAIVVQTNKLAR